MDLALSSQEKEDGEVSIYQKQPEQQTTLSCYTYDAGKTNLFEINFYERLVTSLNFQPNKLVGPAVNWECRQMEMFGVLVCQEGQWAVVLWNSGNINRHRIGSNGVYELTYVDIV